MTDITLESLVGEHELSGVDFGEVEITDGYNKGETSNTCMFVLDGVVYTAAEDPNDGYRSHMRALIIGGEVANRFPPQRVLCSMQTKSDDHSEDDLLVMRDAVTGKSVLTIGTSNTDDYYPYYTAEFDPTSMACNQTV